MPAIAISPFGLVTTETLARLYVPVREAFARQVVPGPPVRLPASAYDARRRQVLSAKLLDELAAVRSAHWEGLLGVADVDLYAPRLNFVFGEADPRRGLAVISLWRLRSPGGIEDARFVERAVKEAIHELGHSYGLGHCHEPACVMWFSNTLGETDRKRSRFCPRHLAALDVATRNGARA